MCAAIRHRSGKTAKQFLFETQLDWLGNNVGALTAQDIGKPLYVATPPVFGGSKGHWSPEQLFLNAISSSYMTAYLAYAKKMGCNISRFSCGTIGKVEIIEGTYKFSNINLYPQIGIADESHRKKACTALEKTNHHCLVINSLNAPVYFHSQIFLDEHPKKRNLQQPNPPQQS